MIRMLCFSCNRHIGYIQESWESGGGHSFFCLDCVIEKRIISERIEIRMKNGKKA